SLKVSIFSLTLLGRQERPQESENPRDVTVRWPSVGGRPRRAYRVAFTGERGAEGTCGGGAGFSLAGGGALWYKGPAESGVWSGRGSEHTCRSVVRRYSSKIADAATKGVRCKTWSIRPTGSKRYYPWRSPHFARNSLRVWMRSRMRRSIPCRAKSCTLMTRL